MSTSRQKRLVELVAEIRRGRYPNAGSFSAYMYRRHGERVSAKTIQRDVAYLRTTHNAPIRYDEERRGYWFTRDWGLPYSELLGHEYFAGLVACRALSATPLPSMQEDLDDVMAAQLAAWEPEDTDPSVIDTILFATSERGAIDPDVCAAVLDGWRQSRVVRIQYATREQMRDVEPHGLFLRDGVWYCRAWCRLVDAPRTFCLGRIRRAETLADRFDRREALTQAIREGKLADLPTHKDVLLRIAAPFAHRFVDRIFFPNQETTQQPDGACLIRIPEASEAELMTLALGQAGRVEILQPPALRQRIRELATACLTLHR